MSEEWKKDRIGSAIRGENPMVIATLKSGFAVIGDTQFLPGYCVLLPNRNVNSLNNLSLNERRDFLIDMSLMGDAILTVCNPRRINYEILGNTDVFLHAHIFPRYEWEEEERKKRPVWDYPKNNWTDEDKQFFNIKDGEKLKENLKIEIEKLILFRLKRRLRIDDFYCTL